MPDISVTLKTGTMPYRIDTLKKIPLGNFGDDFNFTIQDSTGTALNITGTTPKFTLYREGAQHELIQAMQKDCTIDVGASGTCHYTVQQSDFTKQTQYYARVEIYTSTTKIESTQDFLLEVY